MHSKPDIIYKLCIELVITNNMIRVPDPILNLMITLDTSRLDTKNSLPNYTSWHKHLATSNAYQV